MDTEMADGLDHLRKMKQRVDGNQAVDVDTSTMSPVEKIEMLEKALNTFRAEMDMKMTIIQQILTTRNEQVAVQQKLLDHERTLYSTLLSHWLDTPQLAANGVSMNFTSADLETESGFDYEQELDPIPSTSGTGATPKPSRKSQRKRRKVIKTDPDGPMADMSGNGEETYSIDIDPMKVLENDLDEDDLDEDWNAFTRERRVTGGKRNEVEEDLSKTHVCKVCQKRYRFRNSLWRHTKFECTQKAANYFCSLCTATMRRPDAFLKHLLRSHKIKADRTTFQQYTRQTPESPAHPDPDPEADAEAEFAQLQEGLTGEESIETLD